MKAQTLRDVAELAMKTRHILIATHMFEEPGTLAEVARLAAEWFTGHLATGR